MFIQSVSIEGFRSLAHVKIGKLGKLNVLYGENNAGKSNVIAALEMLFRVERVEEQESRVGRFIRGELSDFVDNFTIGKDGKRGKNVKIVAKLGFDDTDLSRMPKFDTLLKTYGIYKKGHTQWITIETEVESTGPGKATKTVRSANVNNKPLYDYGGSDKFLPGSAAAAEERQAAVEEVFSYLINSFALIHAERFLREEKQADNVISTLSVDRIKQWLLAQSQSRGTKYEVFEEIVKRVNAAPFQFGVVRPFVEAGKLGLLVTDGDGRELMIERVGTGVQQIILLISHIVSLDAKLIAIEEVELNLSPSLQYRLLELFKKLVGQGNDKAINQLFLTSHSQHLSTRHDVCLYAVEKNAAGETDVKWGPSAVSSLRSHFDYGLFRLPGKKIWRS